MKRPETSLQHAREALRTLERRRDWLGIQLHERDRTRPYPARIAGELFSLNWAITLMQQDIAERERRVHAEAVS